MYVHVHKNKFPGDYICIFSNIEVEFKYFSFAVLMNIFTFFYFHFLKPTYILFAKSQKRDSEI